jgi:hypothetical protein
MDMVFAGRPTLYVEGTDDLHSLVALVQRHGLDMSEAKRPFHVSSMGGDVPLLEAMGDAIRNATDRPVGFVLDIDTATTDRWSAVRTRLREAGLSPPASCPAAGYIDQLPHYPHGVGVWMMPDCIRDHGKLENLLHTLVPAGDVLWHHADTKTGEAQGLGAAFSVTDRDKAVLHCWLAWQQVPGLPFGTAIKAAFLGHDSPEAIAFLRWLKDLFQLAESGLA